MFRMMAVVLALGVCSSATAQISTYADIKAKSGAQLSAADLNQLMPGAKVVSRTQAGSTRSWENKADGTFVASSDGRGSNAGKNVSGTGNGTWKVTPEGRYCVAIQWNRLSEEWCRLIFKVSDKYYGIGKLDETAVANEFEFSK